MSAINTVKSSFLRHMTDPEIRAAVQDQGQRLVERAFPGIRVQANSLEDALRPAESNFEVGFQTLLKASGPVNDADTRFDVVTSHEATVRLDTGAQLGIVGKGTYGIVQTPEALASVDILAKRGDIQIVNVEQIGGGAKIRVTALIGVSSFQSIDGAPNTLCHFGVFEASHDGNSSDSSALYTLRVECFNGMTSREMHAKHTLRHTSKAADRVEAYTETVLTTLIGEVEAETAMFARLIERRMAVSQFETFATELLGGELADDASKAMATRRENEMAELLGYFEGGNQGAGRTAWGAYNSVTRWIEAKREGITDAKKAAAKFGSNFDGAGSKKVSKALQLLTR